MSSELDSFVPQSVLKIGAPADANPTEITESGCILFADLSGFTALSNKYAQHETGGGELLQTALNSVFQPLVESIYKFGGDIVSFPGDAAIAIWSHHDVSDISQLARLATQAAIDIQKKIALVEPLEDLHLHLRIALTTSDLRFKCVGGSNDSWLFLVQSSAFQEIPKLLSFSNPGEVFCTAEFKSLIENFSDSEPREHYFLISGCKTQESIPASTVPNSTNSPAPFVSEFVSQVVTDDQVQWLSEFRVVSVLFIRIELEDDTLSTLHSVVREMQSIVRRYDGSINQLVYDDKGLVAVAAFGIQNAAHEDDSVRAVKAGSDIHNVITNTGNHCQAGIATGQVFVGLRGSNQRKEIALIGHPVNLAARLMMEAEGVFCDNTTHDYSRSRFMFEKLPPVNLKGLAEQTSLFRLVGQKQTGITEHSILGREAECTLLEKSIKDFEQSGERGLLLIRGNPGIGKSELMKFVIQSAQTVRVNLLKGATDSIEASSPYFALRPIVFDLLGSNSQSPVEEIQSRISKLFSSDIEIKSALLAPVLHIPMPEVQSVSDMNPMGRSEAVIEVLVELFERSSREMPILLLLEDVHWLDGASSQFLEKLLDSNANVMVIVSKRPIRDEPLNFLSEMAKEIVELGELSRDDSTRLLCRALDVDSVQEEVASYVYERSGGQPLFTEQIARSLRNHPSIEIKNSECLVSKKALLDELDLPYDLTSVITSTLDSLPLDHQILLKIASIFGLEFDQELLWDLSAKEVKSTDIKQILNEIQAVGLVESQNNSYLFKHALIQQAVYNIIPTAQKKKFHEQIGRQLEAKHSAEKDKVCSLLAHHFELGEEFERATIYLEIAGKNALTRDYANHDAIKFFSRLTKLPIENTNLPRDQLIKLPDGAVTNSEKARRANWYRSLGEAHIRTGNSVEAAKELTESLKLLGQPFPMSKARVYLSIVAGLCKRMLITPKYPDNREMDPELRSAIEDTVAAFERSARITYTEGRSEEGVACSLRALPLAEFLGPSFEYCNEYAMMANVIAITGRMKLATKYAELAKRVAKEIDNKAAEAHAHHRALLFRMQFADQSIRSDFKHAAHLFEELGNLYEASMAYSADGRLAFLAGDFAESERLFNLSMDRSKRGDAVGPYSWSFNNLGETSFRMGRLDDAQRYCNQGADVLESNPREDQGAIFHNQGLAALIALRNNQPKIAWNHARKALHAHSKGGWLSFSAGAGYQGILEVLLHSLSSTTIDIPNAEKTAKRLISKIKRHRSRRVVIPFAFYYGAILDRLLGKQDRAEKQLQSGISLARELSMPFELALMLRELVRVKGDSDSSVEEKEEYQNILRHIGSDHEII